MRHLTQEDLQRYANSSVEPIASMAAELINKRVTVESTKRSVLLHQEENARMADEIAGLQRSLGEQAFDLASARMAARPKATHESQVFVRALEKRATEAEATLAQAQADLTRRAEAAEKQLADVREYAKGLEQRDRDTAEKMQQRDELLREWYAAWLDTTDGDRVAATQAVLRERKGAGHGEA